MTCSCKYKDQDRYAIMRHLLVGPVTLALYLAYAIGYTAYNKFENKYAKLAVKYLYGFPFLVVDILYNWVVGSFIWLEFPKEYTYTSRLSRKKEEGHALASQLCGYLSIYDEDHC